MLVPFDLSGDLLFRTGYLSMNLHSAFGHSQHISISPSVMLRNQECMERSALISELTVCNNTANTKLQDIQRKMYQYHMSAYLDGSDAADIDRLTRQLCS